MKVLLMVLIAGLMVGCSSLPKLQDLNKIDAGMTKKQVMDKLGEPKSKKMVDGREIYEYDMKDDDGELKPRVVVFQDREVIFYGRPSEYQAQMEKQRGTASGNGGGASVVVNPNINPIFNPIFNVGIPQASQAQQQPSIIYQQAPQNQNQMSRPLGNGSYFYNPDGQ